MDHEIILIDSESDNELKRKNSNDGQASSTVYKRMQTNGGKKRPTLNGNGRRGKPPHGNDDNHHHQVDNDDDKRSEEESDEQHDSSSDKHGASSGSINEMLPNGHESPNVKPLDPDEVSEVDEFLEIRGQLLHALSEDSSISDESDSDDGYESIDANGDLTSGRRQQIYHTRDFLRHYGTDAFIKKFLPNNASTSDIIKTIHLLGFEIDASINTSDIYGLANFLRDVLTKVFKRRTQLTDFYSIDHVLDKLKSSNKILVITGAGISTSLGIPDFRSDKGLYSQLASLGLNDPQEVFDLEIFHSDPKIFYSIAHKILPPRNIFTPLHSFIKLLESKNKLLRNYTQNIDNIESNAGISASKIVQCHGSFATASCVSCGYQVDGEEIRPYIESKSPAFCPKCAKQRLKYEKSDNYFPESFGVFKPDITFFGEGLPKRFHDLLMQDLDDCDLLISIGTSLQVAPVGDIVDKIPPEIPQILINRDPIPRCNFDVSLLGYCDDAAVYLCKRLGWHLDHVRYQEIDNQGISLKSLNEYDGTYRVINDSAHELSPYVTNGNDDEDDEV